MVFADIDGESFSSSLSVPALTNFTAVAGVVDAKRAFSGVTPSDPSLYSYEWQTLSTKCGIVDTSDSTGQSTLFKLLNVGSFSVNACTPPLQLRFESAATYTRSRAVL